MLGVGVEVLGVIAVGIGAAAVLFSAIHAMRKTGRTPPAWLLPAGIGASMIAYSVWNDYAWFGRARDRLPDGAEVLIVGRDSYPWAPWTYLAPAAVRFAALDPATIRDVDGIRQADVMLYERRGQTLVVPQEFDCAKGQIRLPRGDWTGAAADDPAFAVVCGPGESRGKGNDQGSGGQG